MPRNANHEFWLRKGLKNNDGDYPEFVSTEIVALGATESDARGIGLLKLTTFLDECREQMRSSFLLNKIECPPVNSNIHRDEALKMATDLLALYNKCKFSISRERNEMQAWEDIRVALDEYSGRYPRFKSLLDYYGVSPSVVLSLQR